MSARDGMSFSRIVREVGAWFGLPSRREMQARNDALREELRLATLGRCTCSGCGRTVLNAWRDADGYHCLSCLAKQRDEARSALT